MGQYAPTVRVIIEAVVCRSACSRLSPHCSPPLISRPGCRVRPLALELLDVASAGLDVRHPRVELVLVPGRV